MTMKKLLALILVLCCVSGCACADFDLSIMSYDDLVALQKAIVAEIMSRPEWKEVEVPAGTWIVGEDIPAGSYSVKPADVSAVVFKLYKDENDKYGDSSIILDVLGKVVLEDGMIVSLNYAAIFAPAVTLGF